MERYVTRNFFCKMCGSEEDPLPYSTLTTAIAQMRVVEDLLETGHRAIDTENPVNRRFLERQIQRRFGQAGEFLRLADDKKKWLDIELKTQDLRIKDITLAQLQGDYIPTGLAQAFLEKSEHLYHEAFTEALRYVANKAAKMIDMTRHQHEQLFDRFRKALTKTEKSARVRRDEDMKNIIANAKREQKPRKKGGA